MKRITWLLIVALSLGALALPAGAAAPVAPQTDCVDFLAFPDNTVMGARFSVSGFKFRALGGPTIPFVNVFLDMAGADVHGVQFANAGIMVAPPASATTVDIEIGVFHTPNVVIRAMDAGGVIVDSVTVASDNLLHTVTLESTASPIARLRFSGGGEEGVINSICST